MSASYRADGVVVAGMHRSGTSAVTRALNLLGLDLGPESDMVFGAEDNPKGFFESSTLTQLNNRLLGILDAGWDAPPEPGVDVLDELRPMRDLAAETFRSVYGTVERLGGTPWVWKDPRISLLLPFWRSVLGRPLAVVIASRHPLEVAGSLARRNGFPLPLGTALWERYTRAALHGASELPVLVTSYERLVEDPASWCTDTRQFLAACGIDVEHGWDDRVRGVADFVDAGLRRVRAASSDDATEPSLTQEQRALHQRLDGLQGWQSRFRCPDLGEESPTTPVLLTTRRRVLALERRYRALPAGATMPADWPYERAPLLSAVVLALTPGDRVSGCIASILGAWPAGEALEIVVVSSAVTEDKLRARQPVWPGEVVLRMVSSPPGPQAEAAWAAGVAHARGALVLLASDDTRVDAATLRALADSMQPDAAAATCTQTMSAAQALAEGTGVCVLAPRAALLGGTIAHAQQMAPALLTG